MTRDTPARAGLGEITEVLDGDAELLVIGRAADRSRVEDAVLGSVSSRALQNARRPVLVVPAPEPG